MQQDNNNPRASKHSILYIEDNDDNIYMLCRRLKRRHFDVYEARTGIDGIALAKTLQPSLIIMDLVLPDINGWEATQRLKANASTREIPVIALTASASTADLSSALAVGCADFETKPVDFDRLMTKITALIS